jgi:hypothetical protein
MGGSEEVSHTVVYMECAFISQSDHPVVEFLNTLQGGDRIIATLYDEDRRQTRPNVLNRIGKTDIAAGTEDAVIP